MISLPQLLPLASKEILQNPSIPFYFAYTDNIEAQSLVVSTESLQKLYIKVCENFI